jgi:signal transduction histidine kinase
VPISQRFFRQATLAFLAIGFALLLAIGIASVWLVERNREYGWWVAHTEQVVGELNQLLATLLAAETGQRGFLLTADDRYLEPYDQAISSFAAEIEGLRSLMADNPRQLERIDRLVPLASAKMREWAERVQLVRDGRRDEAVEQLRNRQPFERTKQIRALIAEMSSDEDQLLGERREAADRGGFVLLVASIAGGIGIAIVAVASLVLTWRYLREVRRARDELAQVNADLDRTVQERTAELRQANEEIQRFAYIVSHDLRSPLVNIMGFTGEIEAAVEALPPETREALSDDLPEAIRFIRSSTDKMDRLINAILRLSREGRRSFRPERLDLNRVLGDLANSYRHRIEQAGGTIRVEPGLPEILCDRIAVEQVFGNLLDNAVKYLDEARPGEIEIRGRRRGRLAEVEISDNGRGIAEADRERIFEPFRRAGRLDKPGEGIGLAHVRTLLRRLGGTISCESRPGRGSTFRVTVPITLSVIEEQAA